MKSNKKAVSLVEVLVVLLIVGVLTALLLPAVQSAREARRRAGAEAMFDDAEFDQPTAGLVAAEPVEYLAKQPARAAEKPADRLPGSATPTSPTDRKIIYTATVQLVVEDFESVGDRVVSLVREFDGYVADSKLAGASGQNRRASWKVRVPIARFDDFVAQAKSIGELVSASTSSQDVSEEYFDVEARIRNKSKEEERLLKLLEERPGKLEDVIAIERELARVREELDRMQGRMRFLADRTALTTVQLEIAEVHNYVPAEAPAFATRIRRAWENSLDALRSTAEGLMLLAVSLAPWLLVIAVLVASGYPFVRRWSRHLGSIVRPSV